MKAAHKVAIATIILIVIVIAVIWYFVSMPAPMGPTPESEVIKIGVIAPITGPSAAAGLEIKTGAEIARDEINAAGGVTVGDKKLKIELIVEDDKLSPEAGVTAAKKLILQDKVHAIIGISGSSVALAVQDICEEYKTPLVITGSWADAITLKHYNYTFRGWTCDTMNWRSVVEFLKYYNFTRVALVVENTDFGDSNRKIAQKLMSQYNITYMSMIVSRDALDYSSEILAIKSYNPRAVVTVMWGVHCFRFTSQAVQLGLINSEGRVHLEMSTALATWVEELFPSLGNAANYQMFTGFWVGPRQELTPLTRPVIEEFTRRTGRVGSVQVFTGYDGVLAVAKAIEISGSLEPDKIVEGLRKVDITGSLGRIKYETDPNDPVIWQHRQTPVMILQYNATAYQLWDPNDPSKVLAALNPVWPIGVPNYVPLQIPP